MSGPGAKALARELRGYIIEAYYAHPPVYRVTARWVMSPEWELEVRNLPEAQDAPLWPRLLMGLPYVVVAGGGAPHLEPREEVPGRAEDLPGAGLRDLV